MGEERKGTDPLLTAPASMQLTPNPEGDWWGVAVLSSCWALNFAVLTSNVTTTSLVAKDLGAGGLATVPLALQLLSMGFYNLVLPRTFRLLGGRKNAYRAGAVLGALGCALELLACELEAFWLLCVGSALAGCSIAHGQNYRFGALMLVPKERHPKAIGAVLLGGCAGALLGPGYSAAARSLLATEYSGVFLVSIGSFLLLLLILCIPRLLVLPMESVENEPSPQPLAGAGAGAGAEESVWRVFSAPRCWGGTAVAAQTYAVMCVLMSPTPLAMKASGFSFAEVAYVVQCHMVSMFAPSPLSGSAVGRFGASPVAALGAVLIILCSVVMWLGTTFAHYCTGMIILGLGWNASFVAATAAVQKCVADESPGLRQRAQAVNDVAVFVTSGVSTLLAAPALEATSWRALQAFGWAFGAALLLTLAAAEALDARRPKPEPKMTSLNPVKAAEADEAPL